MIYGLEKVCISGIIKGMLIGGKINKKVEIKTNDIAL